MNHESSLFLKLQNHILRGESFLAPENPGDPWQMTIDDEPVSKGETLEEAVANLGGLRPTVFGDLANGARFYAHETWWVKTGFKTADNEETCDYWIFNQDYQVEIL